MTLTAVPDIADEATLINRYTVDLLEDWLERAKAGEIVEVVIAGINDRGECVTNASGTLDIMRRLGALEIARDAYLAHVREMSRTE